MSNPRNGWWSYAKWMIRKYDKGTTTEKERAAVRAAEEETRQYVDGGDRMKLVDMVLRKRTHTLQGAAMTLCVSERTARRWHTDFIRCVAEKRGLM